MSQTHADRPGEQFKSGRYVTRRVVRAWQLKAASTYLAPGATRFELMPEGTWVLEDVGRRERRDGDKRNRDDRRWAVQAHLFPRKYWKFKKGRHSNKDLYLNTESIQLESVQSHKARDDNESLSWESSDRLRTDEGLQQVSDQEDLIATGQFGDCWPIKRARVDSGEYKKLCLRNRLLLALVPARLGYVALRLLGATLVVTAIVGTVIGLYAILSGDFDTLDPGSAAVRVASLVLIFLPAIGRWGLSLAAPKSKRPPPISIVLLSASATVVLALLAGYRSGNGLSRSILDAFRQFTGGTYEQSIDGSIGILAESTSLVATSIVVMSFVAVARIIFREAWDYAVAKLRPYDLIIVGLGTSTVRLMEDIRSNSTLGDTVERIVIVERDRANPRIPRVRDLGAQVIIREVDEDLIRQLATYPVLEGLRLHRRWKTEFILAFTSDEDFNLRVAEMVDSLRSSSSGGVGKHRPATHGGHVTVSVRVEDLWTQERYWRNPITRTDTRTQIYITNSFDTAAEEAFETAKEICLTRESGCVHGPIVMIGSSHLGVAMLHKLRQEYLLGRLLEHMTARYSLSASAAWKWDAVHWIAQGRMLEASRALQPRDINWGLSQESSAAALDVYHHELGEIDAVDLIRKLEPSTVIVLGREASTEWYHLVPSVDEMPNGPVLLVECDSTQRLEFDQCSGVSSRAMPQGPIPIITDAGLTRPGSRLHGHVGIVAEAIHKYFSYRDAETDQRSIETQQWTSEFLDPLHRESTFRLVHHALDHLDKGGGPDGYILQRVSRGSERGSREKTDKLTEEELETAAKSEYERYKKERSKAEELNSEEWEKRKNDDCEKDRQSIRFLEMALFTIGFELIRRRDARASDRARSVPSSSQQDAKSTESS